jgi:hypothetical protein
VNERLTVPVCVACDRALWPPRPVCPFCGAVEFAQRDAGEGIVEEATRHAGVALASVRCAAGPVVIARLEGEALAGAGVALRREDAPGGGRRIVASPTRG